MLFPRHPATSTHVHPPPQFESDILKPGGSRARNLRDVDLKPLRVQTHVLVCVFPCTSGTHTGGTTSSDLLCSLLLAVGVDLVEAVSDILAVDRLV